MLPSFVCEVTLGYMLAYRNCKCAEQLKFTITICGSYNMGKPDIIYEDNDINRLLQAGGNCYTDQAYRAAGYGELHKKLQGG